MKMLFRQCRTKRLSVDEHFIDDFLQMILDDVVAGTG